jgi:hypothetical protein
MEMLADRAYAELRERGVLNTEGEPRRLFGDYVKLRRAQLPYSMALGLTPAGRIAIKAGATDAALDLVSLMSGAAEPAADAAEPDEPEQESK